MQALNKTDNLALFLKDKSLKGLKSDDLQRLFLAVEKSGMSADDIVNAQRAIYDKAVNDGVEISESILNKFKVSDSKFVEGAGKAIFKTRKIDDILDSSIISKVKDMRGAFTGDFKRGNFGFSEVNIKGLDQSDFYSHSRISNYDQIQNTEFASKVKSISREYSYEESYFKPLKVDSDGIIDSDKAWLRNVDTEHKMLEDIARKLQGNRNASGTIKLFTELPPCPSCQKVVREFCEMFKNINVEVVHK